MASAVMRACPIMSVFVEFCTIDVIFDLLNVLFCDVLELRCDWSRPSFAIVFECLIDYREVCDVGFMF